MKRGKDRENDIKNEENTKNMNESRKSSPDFTKIKLSRDF